MLPDKVFLVYLTIILSFAKNSQADENCTEVQEFSTTVRSSVYEIRHVYPLKWNKFEFSFLTTQKADAVCPGMVFSAKKSLEPNSFISVSVCFDRIVIFNGDKPLYPVIMPGVSKPNEWNSFWIKINQIEKSIKIGKPGTEIVSYNYGKHFPDVIFLRYSFYGSETDYRVTNRVLDI